VIVKFLCHNGLPVPTAVSIVIPLFNEEACVPPLLAELRTSFWGSPGDAEVISWTTAARPTAETIEDELPRLPQFTLSASARIRVRPRPGAGLSRRTAKIIVFMDAIFPDDRASAAASRKMEEGYDLVSGWRRIARIAPSRAAAVSLANGLIGWVTGIRRTTRVHAQGVPRPLLKPLRLYSDMHRLSGARSQTGARIARSWCRTGLGRSESKVRLNRCSSALDLFVIQMIVHFSNRPMHFFGA